MNWRGTNWGFSDRKSRSTNKGLALPSTPLRQTRDRDLAKCWGKCFSGVRVGGRAEQMFAAYVEAKKLQNILDYDDMLIYGEQTVSDSALAETSAARLTMYG